MLATDSDGMPQGSPYYGSGSGQIGGGRRGNSRSGGSYPAPQPPPPPPSSGSGGKQPKCVERYNGRCTCWEDEYGKLCA